MNVTLPAARIPITMNGDAISAEWLRWAHDVTERIGGPTGSSTTDLVVSQFEDAGIPEQQAEIYTLANLIQQLPTLESRVSEVQTENHRLTAEVEELRGWLYWLAGKVGGIEQGLNS